MDFMILLSKLINDFTIFYFIATNSTHIIALSGKGIRAVAISYKNP